MFNEAILNIRNKNYFLKKIFFICILIFLAAIQSSFGQVKSSFEMFVDSLAKSYQSSNNNLALIIGMNSHGKEQIYYYGETEKGNAKKPSLTSLFEIGQLTQIFTSSLYADLSVKGIIKGDDELQKYLPVDVPAPIFEKIVCSPISKEVVVPMGDNSYRKYEYTGFTCKPDPEFRAQPILLCYLSTHTSGLPDRPVNLKGRKENPYGNYSKEDLYTFLRSFNMPERIGYDFRYSNLGMALLGHAMEIKTKQSYEKLIVDSICSRLGMSHTGISLSETESREFLYGHNASGEVVPHWTYDIMAPCGGLHSNIGDMMKFLAANLGTVKTPLKDVFDYMHNPRIIFHNKKFGDASIGLSWMVSPLGIENRNYVWLNSLTGGFASFIGFEETTLNGVVILSNTALPVEEMGKNIISHME